MCPRKGNEISAIEFKRNIVPKETVISRCSAFMVAPTAAMALTPQMAVPEDISMADI